MGHTRYGTVRHRARMRVAPAGSARTAGRLHERAARTEEARMHLLVLGGTHFVGLHIVEAALRAGHTVDVFTRGRSPAPTGARLLVGDRNGDLSALDTALDV